MRITSRIVVLAVVCFVASSAFSDDGQPAKSTYTATASIHIARNEPFIATPPLHRDSDKEYDSYKKTQGQLLMSPFVLLRALGKPDVRKLPRVQREHDPVRWLKGIIKVNFPGDTEIMTISCAGNDPSEAVALARAVVDSYMTEVVNAESDRKRQCLSELENICVGKEREIRSKRQELKSLAIATSPESLAMFQKMALEEWSDSRLELRQIRAELRGFKRDLAVQNALLKDAASEERAAILKEIKRLEAFVAATNELEAVAETKAASCRDKVERLTRSSVDVEMLRADLKNSEAALAEVLAERSRQAIELRASMRITLLEPPEEPLGKD